MMNLHFNFRNIKPTEALKEHLSDKAKKIEKYVSYPIEVHFFLKLEKAFHIAEIAIHAEHRELIAMASSKDLYDSIDMSVNKLQSQLRKEREKRKGHKQAHKATRSKMAKVAKELEVQLPHLEKHLK